RTADPLRESRLRNEGGEKAIRDTPLPNNGYASIKSDIFFGATCQRKKQSKDCFFSLVAIQAAGLAYHHRAKRGVYHQPLWGCISSREACIPLRLDDMPQQVADDIQHSVLMLCKTAP
ncbi:MAG: hypothetical protein J6C26_06305, partial [Clostridia bacterium]|nr:hypothetical protein [Clostridia bacterium]